MPEYELTYRSNSYETSLRFKAVGFNDAVAKAKREVQSHDREIDEIGRTRIVKLEELGL